MMPAQIARIALEYWRASGARTTERLRALVSHFADLYLLSSDARATAQEIALASVRAWEIAR